MKIKWLILIYEKSPLIFLCYKNVNIKLIYIL